MAERYIDLGAFQRGGQDKWWLRGARARGAVWWLSRTSKPDAILLCEGETDALAAFQDNAPFAYIGCIPGANTGCKELVDRLVATGKPVTLAFDNDDAGEQATQKFAWWLAERDTWHRIVFKPGVKDLRKALEDPNFRYERKALEQTPVVTQAPAIPSQARMKQHKLPDEKPDLQTVWSALSPRSKPLRKDGQGRAMRQAWCPIHDDGKKPAAWVGEDRWGCFVCGIESADVYELVAWVRGYAAPGTALSGDAFLQSRKDARQLG